MPKDKINSFIKLYVSDIRDILNNLATAAFIKIDSCLIDMFEKENVEKVLKLDTNKFQVSIILPFKYRINE